MLTSNLFDLDLAPFTLEGGARLTTHRVRGWVWSTASDVAAIGRIASGNATSAIDDRPTVLVVHALTGDAQVGGEGGWWEPLIGRGRAIDPTQYRVLCFNNLGSCYGSTGPDDVDFPLSLDEAPVGTEWSNGADALLPATVTTLDQARSIIAALGALGITRLKLVVGGSIGGMITMCLRALPGPRADVYMPIAACSAASPWIIGWNHVGRQMLLSSGLDGDDAHRTLAIARQLALMTYRAEPGLQERQGRAMANNTDWSASAPYRMQTYLEHQGRKLVARFTPRAYFVQLGAMDHHDLRRISEQAEIGTSEHVIAVGINSDALFYREHSQAIVDDAVATGQSAEYRELNSKHGHDAFLIEWDQMEALLRHALNQTHNRPPLRPGEELP